MITVDGNMRRLDDVEDDEVREHLLTALENILAEEGVDLEQVKLRRVSFYEYGNYTIELKRK